MYKRRTSVICTMLRCFLLLSCSGAPTPAKQATATSISAKPFPSPTPYPMPTLTAVAPKRYTLHTVSKEKGGFIDEYITGD